MKKILLLAYFLICNTFFGMAPHEHYLERFWTEVSNKRKVDERGGFLPENILEHIDASSHELREGEKMIVTFYPEKCGFEKLFLHPIPLMKVEEFRQRAEERGFKVNFCLPHRFLAKFESADQLENFLKERFETESIPLEKYHLRVPGRIVIAEIERL